MNALPTFLAGTPVAVLAGFDLTTAILVVSQRPMVDHWSTLASFSSTLLLIGATAFLATLALAARAQFIVIDPGQAHAWFPEMVLDDEIFNNMRKIVWVSQERVADLVKQATWSWSFGLFLTGIGAGLGVLSYGINAGHILAACVLGVGSLVVVCILNRRTDRVPNRVKRMKNLPPLLTDRALDLMLKGGSPATEARGTNDTSGAAPNPAGLSTRLRVGFTGRHKSRWFGIVVSFAAANRATESKGLRRGRKSASSLTHSSEVDRP